jgi:Phosphotransferase enzyme family
MSANAPVGIRPAHPPEAPSPSPWGRLPADLAEPTGVEVLKGKRENARKRAYRLAGAGPDGSDVIAKRGPTARALVERTIYEEVLPCLPLPALRYYGLVEEPDGPFAWLFLEDAGNEEYSVSRQEHQRLAARWLGLLHTSAARVAPVSRLPDRGPAHYLGQVRSARDRIRESLANPVLKAGDRALLKAILSRCAALEACWGGVERWCAEMPRTLVHGDLKANNLRIRSTGAGPVLLAFDWASAGWGVPAVDLTRAPPSCPGFGANPDLGVYEEAVRDHWPGRGPATIRQWADVATLFRSLVALNAEAANLKHEWADESMAKMWLYRGVIDGVVHAAGWAR